jgi:hypothetical protein
METPTFNAPHFSTPISPLMARRGSIFFLSCPSSKLYGIYRAIVCRVSYKFQQDVRLCFARQNMINGFPYI